MAFTQTGRPFRLKSTLGDDALLLESFSGQERMSTPFRYRLRVLSENANINIKELLSTPLVLTMQLPGGKERHFHGLVSRMSIGAFSEDGLAAYEIEMVPWLWFLTLFTDCRIFQNKSVPQILQAVFDSRGLSSYRLSLSKTYSQREYCVQYRETDFNFVHRLMEEEGIFYYFRQTKDSHTLVICDQPSAVTACPNKPKATFLPSTGIALDEDIVTGLEQEFSVHTGVATLTDYDFTKPSTNLTATSTGTQPGSIFDFPGKYLTRQEGDALARVRLEEQEAKHQTVRGTSNCRGFESGYKFDLEGHFRDESNQQYVLTSVQHTARNSSYRSNSDPDSFEYQNTFEAIPAGVPFRPPRECRRPIIEGAQTAVVVGKSGEEVWTDKYGRVKVQFHWDHEGSANENSSCWIRVSSAWAGKQWGAIYIPRIGQEVVVTFLEGDPDQPLITGRVYNADQMPPYSLPGAQLKSSLKSMSSKGGGGFNEIRFDDAKGKEQIFVHGEKNLDVRVKNDRYEWTGNDRHLLVKNNKIEKVTVDEHHTVGATYFEKVGADHFLEILGNEGIKVKGDHSLSVDGAVVETVKGAYNLDVTQDIYIKGKKIVIEAATGITLSVGGNFITIDPSGVSIKGTMVQINSAGAALPGVPGQPVSPKAPKEPTVADDAQPGGTTSHPSSHTVPIKTISLSSVSPAGPASEEEEGSTDAYVAPPQRLAGATGSPEYATFPKSVDAEALAESLKQAAEDGTPFCEECEKPRNQS